MTIQNKEQASAFDQLEQRVERYWDERSEAFSKKRRRELVGGNGAQWQALFREKLPAGPLRVLDIGTGAGFFAILLALQGQDVTGIDMSARMLEEAARNSALYGVHPEFRKMNALAPDFPPGQFDAIVTRNLTWTLPDVMEAYRNWQRLLKPGGILLNFDSDNGVLHYGRSQGARDIHGDVSDRLLQECTEIRDAMRISGHRRPAWDIAFLRSLGFTVTWEENVAPRVYVDTELVYDAVPLFGIYAVKGSGKD
ncbi:MAG: class I SAM-dependent methyltransferase [Succiniclasticum sp.]|nr:class I SAM-dependent methyltransferase [Succiniclasticum sp.]